ncbi:MAG TPA: TraR/DksA C4-type zinc finger protein [Pseudomonas sp.]|nr:TraR/DksA C4-type zinc finger protein [Pseudomonas sp.]
MRYTGESREICIDCEDPIPEGRRQAIPGVERCTDCESIWEARHG